MDLRLRFQLTLGTTRFNASLLCLLMLRSKSSSISATTIVYAVGIAIHALTAMAAMLFILCVTQIVA